MGSLRTLYAPWRCATTLAYMLQSSEYNAAAYLAWYWRTRDFSRVMYRRTLDPTRSARLIRLALLAGMLTQDVVGVLLIVFGATGHAPALIYFGLAALLSAHAVWAHLILVPLVLGDWLITTPKRQRLIAASARIFANHSGVKIAVAGSYGKTSMKELLQTVLGEGKQVAATPGNKNVAISHAYFAKRLAGDEDVLIIEYGEGKPDDVAAFARTTQPTHGIITGLAPAHLDKYKTLEAAGHDIFSLADHLGDKHVYVNADSSAVEPFLKPAYQTYSSAGALGWKVSHVELLPASLSFTLTKAKRTLKLTSGLLGLHQVGPLSLVAALALELGLTEKQVMAGVAKTVPYEHRMQPYPLNGGWVIDDTYNGNIEGVRAGTALLRALPARRKIYITPGLVEQGKDSDAIHEQMGQLIAAAEPNLVILMQNSATAALQRGLAHAGYHGEAIVESDPLDFYTNLGQFVANGDVVLMQNDWTDNYH